MTREELLDGLYEIKNWKCNGDAKTHEVVSEAIKALEQEPILDKLRAEIDNALSDGMIHKKTVLGIIDKYKAETEET